MLYVRLYKVGLIEDKRWMETIEDRNLTSHNYDDDVASVNL